MRYITELTPPVSFYLRGEEYSAQLEAFGRQILGAEAGSDNSLAASAETDRAIELIRREAAAPSTPAGADMAPQAQARSPGRLGRWLGR